MGCGVALVDVAAVPSDESARPSSVDIACISTGSCAAGGAALFDATAEALSFAGGSAAYIRVPAVSATVVSPAKVTKR